MKGTTRRVLLITALLVTLWAVWDVSQPEMAEQKRTNASAPPAKQTAKPRPASATSNISDNLRFPARQDDTSPVRDLFDIPRPPEPKTVPGIQAVIKTAPVAPPLPYVYIGRLEDSGKKQVFLAEGDKTLVVGTDTRLSNGWKLESIENGQLIFVYEPLGQKQSLQIREY